VNADQRRSRAIFNTTRRVGIIFAVFFVAHWGKTTRVLPLRSRLENDKNHLRQIHWYFRNGALTSQRLGSNPGVLHPTSYRWGD